MNTYDFNILSWEEFEEFTKDVLSAEMGVVLDSFANGPDGGVDLRYSSIGSKRDIIVQCKRYKHASSLMVNLKKERTKIDAMTPKPKRYMLSLSLDLTETKVNEIVKLFSPYLSPSDIFTPKKLNSILARHEAVERRHYKLWLSSSNVLKTILSSRTGNYTTLIKEEIEETLRLYSPTPIFGDAMNTLKDNGFIIISGKPGVGKTTLANVMSYYLLGDEAFEELIALPQDMHEAIEMMSSDPDKKQLFLFDDFLGSNYLDQKLSRHEDSVFRTLINHIGHMKKNKALIMTTREYILNQAQQSTSIFNEDDFMAAKYVVNLSRYDTLTKARILYNHIAASDIPEEYLQLFLDKKVYQEIVRHKNYSPRLIGSVNKQKPWVSLTPEEFCKKLIDLFDNPWSLYEDVYTNKITDAERDVLLVVASIGKKVRFDHLHRAVIAFNKECGKVAINEIALKKSIDVLDGTFLSTDTDNGSDIIVDALNPTIYDFIVHYHVNHSNTQQRLIRSAVYLNQITHLFAVRKDESAYAIRVMLGGHEPILVSKETATILENRVLEDWKSLLWIGNKATVEDFDLFSNASRLLENTIVTDTIKKHITKDILDELEAGTVPISDIGSAVSILDYEIDEESITDTVSRNYADSIVESISTYQDLESIAELGWYYGVGREISDAIIKTVTDKDTHTEIFEEEIRQRFSDGDNMDGISEYMDKTLKSFGLDEGFVDAIFDEISEPPEDYDSSDFFESETDYGDIERPDPERDENQAMDNLFVTLR
jgi:adenylate kinase family enzyme